MSSEVIFSFIRQALMFGGSFVVTKGFVDADTLTTVVGAIMTLVSSGFSIFAAKNAAIAKGK